MKDINGLRRAVMANSRYMSVGDALITFLDNQYVSFDGVETKLLDSVFTIFGHGCVVGVGEALSQGNSSIKTMMGKNEQGMALAAMSYAKQNNRRKIIPCFSSIGPGAANMVTAAGCATANNIPLLLFMGDTFATRQPDPVLQQMEHITSASTTTNDAFRAVCRYFDRVSRPEMLMSTMLNAIRALLDQGNAGAVAIALPQDVQGECYDFPESFLQKRVHKIKRLLPSQDEIEDAIKLIKASKYPLLIVGGGVRYSEAGETVEKFATKYNIPFCETQAGKSAAKSSHKLNLGGLGVTGNSAANEIARKADLIIGVGTRFTDFTTASKSLYPDAKVIAINVSQFQAEKLDATPVVADAKLSLEYIMEKLEYKSAYTNEIQEVKAAWDKEMDRLTSIKIDDNYVPENTAMMKDACKAFQKATGANLAQTTAIGIIRKYIPKDAILVGSAGSLPGCLQRMWTTDAKDSYNMEYGYSCMGYEIAGALGSKLAAQDKEVYAFLGDGSFYMLHSELVTAVQERKKINILVFDNGSFGCINNLQMGQGIDALCTEFRYRDGDKPIREGEFLSTDFAMIAKGYGLVSYTARNEEELKAAIEDSLKQEKSTLIDIKVLPKSMTHGYDAWWRVGCTDNPRDKKQQRAKEEKDAMIKIARKY